MKQRASMDAADRFIHGATRAFACDSLPPAPPTDDMWVRRAIDAGVITAISSSLRRAGHVLPTRAQQHRVMTAAVELAALQDLAQLGELLDGVGVPWAVLKGPVLSRVVYAVEGARDYSDLDVLVDPRDFGAAVTTLVSQGARVAVVEWARSIRSRAAEMRLIMPGGTLLDLHWSVVNDGRIRDNFDVKSSTLLSARVHRQIGSVEVATLDDVDVVLHVLLHGCLSGAHRLRWLLDAQQCVNWLQVSPANLRRRADELRLAAPARAMLERTACHLDERVQPWAEVLHAPRAWNFVLGRVNSRQPPSAPSLESRSARGWYGATRTTSRASFSALLRSIVAHVRYRRSPRPQAKPVPASVSDAGYLEWLGIAHMESSENDR